MKRHLPLFMLFWCSLLLYSCTSPGQPKKTVSAPSPSTTYIYSTPSPTLTPPILGKVPTDCPVGSVPTPVFTDIGPVLGYAPFWVTGFDGPHAHIRIASSYDTYTQYGWIWKLIWRVQTDFPSTIAVHGSNLRDATPLWFQIGSDPPSTTPVFSKQQQVENGMNSAGPWVDWGSYTYIPTAGCYSIEATWPGGHWSITFAAGRQ